MFARPSGDVERLDTMALEATDLRGKTPDELRDQLAQLKKEQFHPPRKKDAPEALKPFVYVRPQVGDVLLWESFIRHEVPLNMSEEERISVSFNYKWN